MFDTVVREVRNTAEQEPDLPAVGQVLHRYLAITANWIYEQLRFLREYRPVVLASKAANLRQFPLSPVYSISALPALPRLRSWFARWRGGYDPLFHAAARRERVRLLHAHFGPRGASALPLARALGVPLITSFYGYDLSRQPRSGEPLEQKYARLFCECSLLIAEGPAARAQLIALGCPAEKTRVHRLGIDLSAYPFQPRHVEADRPIRALMAARFVEKKGLPYGVEAVARVAREEPRLSLTIAGNAGRDPRERLVDRELHAIVARHGIEARVHFVGMVPPARMHKMLYEHELLLQPSVHAADGDSEGGHPVILTEAAAAGLPIIASQHCDIPEIVRPGETGWLCPERDVDALVTALQDALAHPQQLERFAANARARVEACYDLRRNTLDSIYNEVIA